MVIRETPKDFVPLRLHYHSDDAWAVVERPSGAIALGEGERLLFKLSQSEARTTAEAMTAALLERKRADQAADSARNPPLPPQP